MDIIKQLLGRLHPLLVHLPIGFIILGLLFQWIDRKKNEFEKIIPQIYLWGGISAVMACITGYLQYTSEGYAFDSIKFHLWLGIVTALFSFLMYLKMQKKHQIKNIHKVPLSVLTVSMFILLSITGHLGGNITHGEDFLIEPLPNEIKSALGFETFEEKIIVLNDEDWEEAVFYEDVIKPILNNKCVSCHNPKKAKGELILSTEEGLLKGGENGEIIEVGMSAESPLYTRLVLPKEDEDHMPPKEKTQLTKEEIKLIATWIDKEHSFEHSIGELGLTKDLFEAYFPRPANNNFPDVPIEQAQTDSINKVKKEGIHVEEISKTSKYLRVSCVNKPDFTNKDMVLLNPILQHIAILDIGGTMVSDTILNTLAELPHLTVLKLDNTGIEGNNIELLENLEYLKSLNLSSSNFKKSNFNKLQRLKKLEKVYLHKTEINPQEMESPNLEELQIDFGNYELPQIASDSVTY